MSVTVRNTAATSVGGDGASAAWAPKGAATPQLYLHYPASAGEPDLVLRGIAKTAVLAPGAAATVTFDIATRDTSMWSTVQEAWVPVFGEFTVRVGLSSRDLRLSATFRRSE